MNISRDGRGFTLIELLVVIAVIALLVSILVPSLKKAKDLAENVICISNCKTVGTAFVMYAADYNQHYVQGGDPLDWNATVAVMWDEKLEPYLDPNTLTCPSQLERSNSATLIDRGYGYNVWFIYWDDSHGPEPDHGTDASVGRHTTPVPAKVVANPAETLLVLDRGLATYFGWWQGADHAANLLDINETNITWGPTLKRHDGRVNVLLADHHVENMDPADTLGAGGHWYSRGEDGNMWDMR